MGSTESTPKPRLQCAIFACASICLGSLFFLVCELEAKAPITPSVGASEEPLEQGWVVVGQGLNCDPCNCSSTEDLALVSYYIAEGLNTSDRTIQGPVPCLSRITVTSVEAMTSLTARITGVCKYCRNKHIALSLSAFARLASNSSADRVEVY